MLRWVVGRVWIILVPLTACGPDVEHNAWPGAEIAYLAPLGPGASRGEYELRVIDLVREVDVALDGARPVTSDMVAWSPDGERIAFVGELAIPAGVAGEGQLDPTGGLFAVDPDGEQLLGRVSEDWLGDRSCTAVSWSPRADRIAVVRRGMSWAPQCQMPGWLLRVAELDPTATSDESIGIWASDVDPNPPVWSPDGAALVIGSEHLVCGDDGELDSFGWGVHECGTGSCSSAFGPTSTGGAWPAAWSHDGRWLAVNVGARNGTPGSVQLELWSADGITSRVLAAGPCSYEGALWFPDDARLITRRWCEGESKRYAVVDAATGGYEKDLGMLGPEPEIDLGPRLGTSITLSPDGTRLAFATEDVPSRIGILDLEDGTETFIADGKSPAWRP